MENLNFVFVAPFTSRPSHLDLTSIFFNPAVTNLFLMGQCFPILFSQLHFTILGD